MPTGDLREMGERHGGGGGILMNMNDAEHIWLRQTVTYTVDGQTRTLEIGVPVPRDASAEEIEELLHAADAGMSAISRRLDAQIAAATGGAAPQLPAPETLAETPSETPRTIATPTEAPERAAVNGRAPAEPPPVAEPAAPGQPPQPATRPIPAAPAHAPTTAPTTPPASPRATERSAAPQRPANQPPPSPLSPLSPPSSPSLAAPAPAPNVSGAEMTRPEFLAAASELGLNPRQAMDRLKVRSLEGLNLREALESLRRQMLGAETAAAPAPEMEPEMEPEPEPAHAPAPAIVATTRYFEEEDDDETIFYSEDTEDEEFDGDILTPSSGSAPLATDDAGDDFMDEPDEELDLEDVPDLAPPSPAPRRRATPATPARETAAAPTPPASATPPTGAARTQAMQLIGRLRAATGGAPASDYQLTAYHNIVENELGKSNATTLVRGLWRTTADRLSAGQLDALIRWGKEEVFAEEAALVLAALRAEQRRSEQASATSPTTAAPATRATTRRQSASRDGEAR